MAQQHPLGQGLMIVDVPRLHSDTPTKIGTTSMGERLARPTDLYLTTHNTHNRQTSMGPAEFEPVIPASEWPQTDALD
jgi:hypothetical protein